MKGNLNKKKLAIVVSGGNLDIPKGLVNSAITRVRYLEINADYHIDVFYLYQKRMPFSVRSLLYSFRKEHRNLAGIKLELLKTIEFQSDVKYVRILVRFINKLLRRNIDNIFSSLKFAPFFQKYDALSVHSNDGAFLALEVKRRYGVPYFVTWHGSDIHTLPFEIEILKYPTMRAIENAECNFFVSRALKIASESLTVCGRKEILYNGADESFVNYSAQQKEKLRIQYGVEASKVVAYVGTIREIKNVILLPKIFEIIRSNYSGKLCFWIIGNGNQEVELKQMMMSLNIECRFWGFQPLGNMPKILNCIDVCVLPSKNEGLPLSAIEALRCGANVVGSYAGGIPELIGEEFCIHFGDSFESRFAKKVVSLLDKKEVQPVEDQFNWSTTAMKEHSFYKSFFERQ